MNYDRYNPFYGILALVILLMSVEYVIQSGLARNLLVGYQDSINDLISEIGWPVRTFFIVFYLLLSIATRGFRFLSYRKDFGIGIKVLLIACFVGTSWGLLQVETLEPLIAWYPFMFLGVFIATPFMVISLGNRQKPKDNFRISCESKKVANAYSFNFEVHGGWINVTNPFRGMLILGSNGSGKTESIACPIIKQAAEKGYCGIIYDFKYPKLTEQYYHHRQQIKSSKQNFYVVNFDHLNETHRLNPIRPDFMKHSSYAREYAHAIVSNLGTNTYGKNDFWTRSSTELLTGVFWFLSQEYPQLCSLPHAVALILSEDDEALLDVLSQHQEVKGMVASMKSALRKGASNQSAGVIGTLQLALASLNTPETFWVLSGNDFDLDLNDPENPKMLALGSNPSLKETYAPIIACIITVALKLMNQPQKHPSLLLLDEAPTVYIPKLDTIPATARANKLSTVFIAQDKSQMIKGYGKVETDSLIGNLNYQLYGRLAQLETAEYVSRLIGREDKIITNLSNSQSRNTNSGGSENIGSNYSPQERFLLKPQQVMGLNVGEFVGVSVESQIPHFRARIKKSSIDSNVSLPKMHASQNIKGNFLRIHKEAQSILAESEKYQYIPVSSTN